MGASIRALESRKGPPPHGGRRGRFFVDTSERLRRLRLFVRACICLSAFSFVRSLVRSFVRLFVLPSPPSPPPPYPLIGLLFQLFFHRSAVAVQGREGTGRVGARRKWGAAKIRSGVRSGRKGVPPPASAKQQKEGGGGEGDGGHPTGPGERDR